MYEFGVFFKSTKFVYATLLVSSFSICFFRALFFNLLIVLICMQKRTIGLLEQRFGDSLVKLMDLVY